ncbi:heat shock 70kDa protein 4 [Clonorchis sinensis]|uniref:Heat shock 70kDa protein 4 n=1 Tax=Clonorchis sinensis TaxID=79923 RepID=G7YJA1_CLOSI|nr:heat shock 70kDa protein 4 [Clonorchis sinensis]
MALRKQTHNPCIKINKLYSAGWLANGAGFPILSQPAGQFGYINAGPTQVTGNQVNHSSCALGQCNLVYTRMGAHAVGFDIGSRNSFVSTLSRYGLHMVSNQFGRRKIPTCLAFTTEGRLAGTLAKMQLACEAKNVLRNFTTLLGKPHGLVQMSDLSMLYDLETMPSGRIGFKVTFANRPWTFVPEQLLAMQLMVLKRMTERYTGTELQNVVLSIPVYYTKSQQQAVRDAMSIAGLKCEKLLPDTTAIALTYAYYARNEIARSSSPIYVAFVSVGYSNTQVSICAFQKHSLEILSTAYDPDLGGKHFDCAVYEVLTNQFKKQHVSEVHCFSYQPTNAQVPNNTAVVRGLLDASETVVKRMNMGAETVTVTADSLSNEYNFCGEIKREKFEAAMCSPLFRYPFKIVESGVRKTPEHTNINPLTQKQLEEFRLVESRQCDAKDSKVTGSSYGGTRNLDLRALRCYRSIHPQIRYNSRIDRLQVCTRFNRSVTPSNHSRCCIWNALESHTFLDVRGYVLTNQLKCDLDVDIVRRAMVVLDLRQNPKNLTVGDFSAIYPSKLASLCPFMEISSLTAPDCELTNMKALLAHLISQLHERVKQPTPRGSISPVSLERLVSIDTWVKRMGKCGSVHDYLEHIKSLRKLCERIKTTAKSSPGKSSNGAIGEREQKRNQCLLSSKKCLKTCKRSSYCAVLRSMPLLLSQTKPHSDTFDADRDTLQQNRIKDDTNRTDKLMNAIRVVQLIEPVLRVLKHTTFDQNQKPQIAHQRAVKVRPHSQETSGVWSSTTSTRDIVASSPTGNVSATGPRGTAGLSACCSVTTTQDDSRSRVEQSTPAQKTPTESAVGSLPFVRTSKVDESKTAQMNQANTNPAVSVTSMVAFFESSNQLRAPALSSPTVGLPIEDKFRRMYKPTTTLAGNLVDSGSCFVRTVVIYSVCQPFIIDFTCRMISELKLISIVANDLSKEAESAKFGSLKKMPTTESACRSEGSTKRHFGAVKFKVLPVVQISNQVSRNDSSTTDIARASVTPPMTLRSSSAGTASISSAEIFRNEPVLPKPPEPDNLSATLLSGPEFMDVLKTSSPTLLDMPNGYGHSENELLLETVVFSHSHALTLSHSLVRNMAGVFPSLRIPSNAVEPLISAASLSNVAKTEVVSKITTRDSPKKWDGDHSFNGKIAAQSPFTTMPRVDLKPITETETLSRTFTAVDDDRSARPPAVVQEPVSSTVSLPSDRIYKHLPKSTQLNSQQAANIRQGFLATTDRPWIGKCSSMYSFPAKPQATKNETVAPTVQKTNATGVNNRQINGPRVTVLCEYGLLCLKVTISSNFEIPSPDTCTFCAFQFASLPPPPEILGSPASLLTSGSRDAPTNSHTRSGAINEIRHFTYRPVRTILDPEMTILDQPFVRQRIRTNCGWEVFTTQTAVYNCNYKH